MQQAGTCCDSEPEYHDSESRQSTCARTLTENHGCEQNADQGQHAELDHRCVCQWREVIAAGAHDDEQRAGKRSEAQSLAPAHTGEAARGMPQQPG